jgi:hypothetical protein
MAPQAHPLQEWFVQYMHWMDAAQQLRHQFVEHGQQGGYSVDENQSFVVHI